MLRSIKRGFGAGSITMLNIFSTFSGTFISFIVLLLSFFLSRYWCAKERLIVRILIKSIVASFSWRDSIESKRRSAESRSARSWAISLDIFTSSIFFVFLLVALAIYS